MNAPLPVRPLRPGTGGLCSLRSVHCTREGGSSEQTLPAGPDTHGPGWRSNRWKGRGSRDGTLPVAGVIERKSPSEGGPDPPKFPPAP